jgi:hypothetical protein
MMVKLARRDLADAAYEALDICNSGEYEELGKYKFDFAGFQKFRAGLPWYRRAFLLYRAPNRFVRIPKASFHLTLLWLALVQLFGVLGGGIVPPRLRA